MLTVQFNVELTNSKLSFTVCSGVRSVVHTMTKDGPEVPMLTSSNCEKMGITREFSVVYTPSQNGRAERFNRTLQERARAMLRASGIAKKYWGDVFSTAAKTHNMLSLIHISEPTRPY